MSGPAPATTRIAADRTEARRVRVGRHQPRIWNALTVFGSVAISCSTRAKTVSTSTASVFTSAADSVSFVVPLFPFRTSSASTVIAFPGASRICCIVRPATRGRPMPAYEDLCEQVRNAPVVTADETGWRVGARSHWLWTAVTPTMTVYAICADRGFDDAQTLLAADFDGMFVRDGWVVYRCFTNGEHQSCLQRLRRRCEQLRDHHPYSPRAGHVRDTSQDVKGH